MNIKILLQAVNTPWMLMPSYAESLSLMVHKVFSGEIKSLADDDDDEAKPKAFSWLINSEGQIIGSIEDSEKEGIALIELQGAVMKYDYCGSVGTKSIAEKIIQANANPGISSIILRIDSPGGSVSGTQELADVILESKKPVVAYADGMMCSAAMWIGASANYRIASSKTAVIGSIGTMCSWADWKAYYEKIGVKVHEVYATDSTEKNIQFREANGNNAKKENNYEPLIKTWLDPLNGVFTSAIKNALPNADPSVLNGAHYVAEEAMQKGLINSIGNFKTAINKALELGGGTSTKSQTQPPKNTIMKWNNFLKMIGIATVVTEAKQITLEDAHVDSMEAVITERDSLQAQVTQLTTERDQAKQKATDLQTQVNNLTQENATLKAADGASGATTTEKQKDTQQENVDTDAMDMDFQKELMEKV